MAKDYSELKGMQARASGASEADVAKAQIAIPKTNGFVDLKRTKKEIKERNSPSKAAFGPGDDTYPYGLTLRFENDALDKLGIDEDELPDVGQEVTLTVKANVTSLSSRQSTGSDDTRCMELQVTKVKMGA